eukprot:CAMPEP_0194144222 /NCGR_PEP_ID=MMETSP0152-20130528/13287_1 /TAXON_ID=1049557 /ORGANISM="Thalassiothrix antarctica, Strain L6-D1" /LENGTH=493 /DNA_ID=CAMNT_0038843967 /DNA_START=276 /DNA_END=1757 /DNA_ORIENTATION=+
MTTDDEVSKLSMNEYSVNRGTKIDKTRMYVLGFEASPYDEGGTTIRTVTTGLLNEDGSTKNLAEVIISSGHDGRWRMESSSTPKNNHGSYVGDSDSGIGNYKDDATGRISHGIVPFSSSPSLRTKSDGQQQNNDGYTYGPSSRDQTSSNTIAGTCTVSDTTTTALRATTLLSTTHRNIVVLSHNVSQDVADGFFEISELLKGRLDVLCRCSSSALWVSNDIRKDTSLFLMLFPHNITIEIQGQHVKGLNPDERTMALYLQRTLLIGDKHKLDQDDADANCSELLDVEDSDTIINPDASQLRQKEKVVRLKQKNRQRPDIINPHKPGALPKSERNRLRAIRKEREAMVRRITKSDNTYVEPPAGFVFHRNDTLQARLDQFAADGPILMLSEIGESLGGVLGTMNTNSSHGNGAVQSTSTGDNNGLTMNSTTTLLLGNQLGYSEADEKLLTENVSVNPVSLGPLSLLTSQCITIMHHYLDARDAALANANGSNSN